MSRMMLELVDPLGRTVGTAEKLSAHQGAGRLHRAFSVFLLDTDGRMLLQRRALVKYHSPGVWSNTCCGHPTPGEAPFLAAVRRVTEELGFAPTRLQQAGTVTYDLPDPLSGLVEREYNHLFVGLVDPAGAHPDPEEVAALRFVTPGQLEGLRERRPFSAWFPIVLDAARPAVRDLAPDSGW